MKKSILMILGVACLGYSCSDDIPTFIPSSTLTEPTTNLVTVQSGFGFTEGPAVDKEGNVFFTDQPNDKIFKWNASTGEITTFLTGTGRANGMAFDKDGNLIACSDMLGEVRKIKPDGSYTVLVNNYEGKLLNGPNDVWINPVTGGMYITDPMFPRTYWNANDPRRKNNFAFDAVAGTYTGAQIWPPTYSEQAATGKGGHVYYLAPGATSLVRVTTMSAWAADSWPNGVVGTPDGKKLYVNKWASNNQGGTWSFDINADGTLTNMVSISTVGGDGMSMDANGNIYISNGTGIVVLDKIGTQILVIPTNKPGSPGGATNNVFAGSDQKTLFITGPSTSVATLNVNVPGVEKF
jgi:gluconolactonase